MESENLPILKALKKTKKKRKLDKGELKLELEPEPEPESVPVEPSEKVTKEKKKKKRKSDKKEVEPEEELYPPVENAIPTFGRRSKIEVNNNTLSPAKSVKGEVSDSSMTSPKELKKKKRKSYDADDTLLAEIDTTANSEFESPSKKMRFKEKDFLKECVKLLSVATEQVTQDSVPYSKTLPNLDYSKIAEHFPDKSPEELKDELHILIEGTVKVKCLHQLLTEALEHVQTEKNVGGGFSHFMSINYDKIKEEMKTGNSGTTGFQVASTLWSKLSQKEKNSYKKSPKKSFGQTPFEIYFSLLSKKGKVTQNEARLKFKNLPIEKKVKYIRKSVKEMMKTLEEIEIRKQEEEEEEMEVDEGSSETLEKKLKCPSKDDAAIYLKYYEYPDEPTFHLPTYYCEERKISLEGQNRLMFANKNFYDLSKEKQEHWKRKNEKRKASYMEEVEEWKKSQDKVTLFVWKTFKDKSPGTKKSKNNEKKPSSGASDDKSKINDYIKQLSYHDVKVSAAKFKDEPVMPPLDPVKVFGIELEKRKGVKYSAPQIKKSFDALDKTQQVTLIKSCEDIKEKFIDGLKDYVGNMSYEQRKLFLGVNRIKYIKALREDIFEEDYPHTEYKVYEKLKKASSPSKTKKATSGSSDPKISRNKEETDQDEEMEEDMKDFQNPKSSKLVEPRNYSSRKKIVKNLTFQEESDIENGPQGTDDEDLSSD